MDLMQGFLSNVKPVFLFLDILFLFGFIYALLRGWKYRAQLGLQQGSREAPTIRRMALREEWGEIRKKFEFRTPEAMRLAVVEADKFVDNLLKNAGYKGEHMADRLEKIIPDEIASIDKLWEAHRFRNELVHTPDFSFSEDEGEKMMQNYEAFLKEAKVLDDESQ